MTSEWLTSLIIRSAAELETAGKTRFRFAEDIRQALHKNPIQEWESQLWARGLRLGLVKLEGYFFRAGTGKAGSLSFFVRNPQGLQVGLRRESITQAATYVTLITDCGYSRDQTRFETGWMDVAVFNKEGGAYIYAENKSSLSILHKLCFHLESLYRDHLPPVDENAPFHDPDRKAHHIRRHRPRYFWGVSPRGRMAYEVIYTRDGFTLSGIPEGRLSEGGVVA